MKKIFKNTFLYIAVLLGIYGVCACNHIANVFTSKKSSYYNDKMITADEFVALTKIMDKGVKKFQAQNGLFILMDVSDSTIVASYTTDNSSAVTDKLYEAGSVFTTFDIAMGLESGKVKNNDKFDTSAPFLVDDITVTDPHGSHKLFTPEGILVASSNIGAAKIAIKVGGEYQYNFWGKLGLLSKINSYNIESATPIFAPKEEWIKSKKVVTTISFGYGMADTPLHIITAYAAMVNGGTYYKPSLDKITDKEGSYVISEKNSALMRGYLRKVVTDGTAKRANSDKYILMGKTGTTYKLDHTKKKYDRDNVITTFVGNFEHNGVNYAILVMLDSPKALKETYGYNTAGWNASPITGNIIEEFIK